MLTVIYEDQSLMVIHKPAGIAVQNASFGKKDLESMVKTYLYEKTGQANPYLGIIHRLDQPVQGLVVFAKNKKSAASLSAQVTDGRMKKYYQAVVCGKPSKKEETLVHYLKKDGRKNLSAVVSEKEKDAKKAVLHYKVAEEQEAASLIPEGKENLSLLEIELFTGRYHQIRAQLSASGFPIYGDQKYHAGAKKGEQLALCASRLVLQHPVTGKQMEFTCEPEFHFE
ncbi:MAG: RluA family pseudouridine synthase [Muricoprocola sp.]